LIPPENFKTKTADLICVKKSNYINEIIEENSQTSLNDILESLSLDYYAESFFENNDAIKIYDIKLNNLVNQ
jgi:hypothetical protein